MQKSETTWPGIIFLATWYLLWTYPVLANWSFTGAILLCLLGVLAQRMAGNAIFRLKGKAWGWLTQVALWYAAFLWFAPLHPATKVLLLWGVATPLVMAGGACRWAYDRYPLVGPVFDRRPMLPPAAVTFVLVAAFAWWAGNSVMTAMTVAALSAALATIPLYYGWKLASPLARGPRDARFGTQDSFRAAGMSDEG